MELLSAMWDLGIAPINMMLSIVGLVMLFVLRATAKKEMEILAKEKEVHVQTWTVYRSYINDCNYLHGLYEEYKYVGYNSNEAHKMMQDDIKGLKIGDLYKPFDTKPSLMTRILMTQIGAK